MAVKVLKIASVTAPKRIARRFHNSGSGVFSLGHDVVNFGFRHNIVADGEARCAGVLLLQPAIVCKTPFWPECQLEASVQIEKRHGPMLGFFADNALCRKPKAVPIEPDSSLKVIYAKSDNGNSRLQYCRLPYP